VGQEVDVMNIDGLLRMPSVMLFLTLAVYALAVQIRARTGNVLCNPVLISTLVLMGYLKVFAIDYELYHSASHFIDFWLKPAVVLLAVPLYRNWDRIRSQWLPVVLSQLAGSVTGIVTGVYFAKWLGASREVILSLASKSVTNPIAIEITASIGGIPAITAATVIIAGLFGQMAGYKVLKGALYMPSSVGMSLGTASHAMGIAASLEYGRRMAAYAGLGLTLNGVLTAILVPILIPLLGV
jgi:predicted murein hydrolase (TIGR00659 family)